jgi:hypothetical protein
MCESTVLGIEQASVGMIFISRCGFCRFPYVSGDRHITCVDGAVAEDEAIKCNNCGGSNFDVPKLFYDTNMTFEHFAQSGRYFKTTRLSRINEISKKKYLEEVGE